MAGLGWEEEIMDVRVGETVLVNAAAFIGSPSRNWEAIPSEVLEVAAGRLLIRTHYPHRVFKMWVNKRWVEQADCVAQTVSE